MEYINTLAASNSYKAATAHDSVLNSECAYTFHSPFTSARGIVVNLKTYVGTIQELAFTNSKSSEEELFVRIVANRIQKFKSMENVDADRDTAITDAPIKLGVGVDGGFASEDDKWEIVTSYSVVILKPQKSQKDPIVVTEVPFNLDNPDPAFLPEVVTLVKSVVLHAGISVQQDLKAWQLDTDEIINVSKYAANLPFDDNGVTIDPDPTSWKCQKTGATDNLWLNLGDGYIGGGRKNWDGSGGSNGALDHFQETGEKYPLTVKLGTLSADLDSADCYSYAKDEDCPVKVPNLGELLEKRGIKLANMIKTVKSTAELEVEFNQNYDFNAITSVGEKLEPASGPGLQGLQNLGNSCYMNSSLQMLFSVPELANRYGTKPDGFLADHPLLQRVSPNDAPSDLLCQTTKIAGALTSGTFARPLAEKINGNDNEMDFTTDPKYRLAPRMLKHLIGKDHVEFSTGQQQDAAQFLQYMLEQLDKAELEACGRQFFKKKGKNLHTSSHLFSYKTVDRLVCSGDGGIKYKESNGIETVWSLPIPMDKAVFREDDTEAPDLKRAKTDEETKDDESSKPVPTVPFLALLDSWGAESTVDGIRWPHLANATYAAAQTTRFLNFPTYLILQIQRYKLGPDWQPIKLEVKLDIPEKIDLTSLRSAGPQDGEILIPEENESVMAAAQTARVGIDAGVLGQLVDMGFSMNGCKRALTAVGGSDVEAAMNWVFEHNMDPDFNADLPEQWSTPAASVDGGIAGVDEETVATLVASLGCFTADQVRAALKETNGAADRAADWLFSHMDDLDAAVFAINKRATESAAAGPVPELPLEDGHGEYSLIGTVSHIGKNTQSGHYVAHMKREDNWVIFNDEKVAYCEHAPIEHAYLYLFQRSDSIGFPNSNY